MWSNTLLQNLGGYRISTNPDEMDLAVIHGFLSNSYWAKGMPLAVLQKAIAHSLCFGVFTDSNQQVGFARVITDKATFAYLSDVFVLDAERGKGLSKWLMQSITAHPDLQGLRRFVLVTLDAHGLYEQFGFTPIAYSERFMEVWNPEVYSNSLITNR